MKSLTYFIAEQLSYTRIFEQAKRLKDFRDDFNGHFTQILQNWALIKAYRVFEIDNEGLVNHWKDELLAKCDEFIDSELKSGNKKKALRKLIFDVYEYNNTNNIYKKIFKKFEKEDRLNKIKAKEISNILSSNLDEIVDVLSSDFADNWVENL